MSTDGNWILPEEYRELEQGVRDVVATIDAEIARLEADFAWKRDYYDNHGERDSEQFGAIYDRFTALRNDALKRREMMLKPLVKILALLPPRPVIIAAELHRKTPIESFLKPQP